MAKTDTVSKSAAKTREINNIATVAPFYIVVKTELLKR